MTFAGQPEVSSPLQGVVTEGPEPGSRNMQALFLRSLRSVEVFIMMNPAALTAEFRRGPVAEAVTRRFESYHMDSAATALSGTHDET